MDCVHPDLLEKNRWRHRFHRLFSRQKRKLTLNLFFSWIQNALPSKKKWSSSQRQVDRLTHPCRNCQAQKTLTKWIQSRHNQLHCSKTKKKHFHSFAVSDFWFLSFTLRSLLKIIFISLTKIERAQKLRPHIGWLFLFSVPLLQQIKTGDFVPKLCLSYEVHRV